MNREGARAARALRGGRQDAGRIWQRFVPCWGTPLAPFTQAHIERAHWARSALATAASADTWRDYSSQPQKGTSTGSKFLGCGRTPEGGYFYRTHSRTLTIGHNSWPNDSVEQNATTETTDTSAADAGARAGHMEYKSKSLRNIEAQRRYIAKNPGHYRKYYERNRARSQLLQKERYHIQCVRRRSLEVIRSAEDTVTFSDVFSIINARSG